MNLLLFLLLLAACSSERFPVNDSEPPPHYPAPTSSPDRRLLGIWTTLHETYSFKEGDVLGYSYDRRGERTAEERIWTWWTWMADSDSLWILRTPGVDYTLKVVEDEWHLERRGENDRWPDSLIFSPDPEEGGYMRAPEGEWEWTGVSIWPDGSFVRVGGVGGGIGGLWIREGDTINFTEVQRWSYRFFNDDEMEWEMYHGYANKTLTRR
ncbi:MAG: hypothetical protein OXI83_04115 [Gemmatimonadota bacterium]|nr:hypothetical protein [Gemmatimonadota bacterium]